MGYFSREYFVVFYVVVMMSGCVTLPPEEVEPSASPAATIRPGMNPTPTPTRAPANTPTPTPTRAPTNTPTPTPTRAPTNTPTPSPTAAPSNGTIPHEGYGANAIGGANSSTVCRVTSLNATGAGSLSSCIGNNRTVLFDVSGTINGRFTISGVSYLTIDGAGRDITINNNNNGDGVSISGSNTHHIVLKNIRVINAGNDGINVLDGARDILISNVSSYGNRDGNIDVASGVNVTVQYSFMGGGASGWSGAMLITSSEVTVHHNLISPATSGQVGERCPLIHANYSRAENVDIRNNLIWKYGRSGGTGSGYGTAVAYGAKANVIGNYYYTAGSSPDSATNTDDGYGSGANGKAFMQGNVSGNSGVNPDAPSNASMISVPAVVTQDACTAAKLVLEKVGPPVRNDYEKTRIADVTLPRCP